MHVPSSTCKEERYKDSTVTSCHIKGTENTVFKFISFQINPNLILTTFPVET